MAVWSTLGRSEAALAALGTATVLLVTWSLIVKCSPQTRRRKHPPGPKGWPILGSLPMLGTLPHQDLFKLSKQYGPLMLINLGSVKCLIVTSPKFAEAILKTHDLTFANRPQLVVAKVST
jgi:flavonoid 3',5'-hydroxylase